MSLTVIFTERQPSPHPIPPFWNDCHVTAVNELVKSNVASFRNKSTDNLSMPERLFAGACAGLCYWVGTFPLDAIKVSACALLKESSLLKNSFQTLCLFSRSRLTQLFDIIYNPLQYCFRFLATYLTLSFLAFSSPHLLPFLPSSKGKGASITIRNKARMA